MNIINEYLDFLEVKLKYYQKVYLLITSYKQIQRSVNIIHALKANEVV